MNGTPRRPAPGWSHARRPRSWGLPAPTAVVTTLLAAFGLVVCAALLGRLAVGARRRAVLDRWVRGHWLSMRGRSQRAWSWNRERRQQRQARRMADDVIRRARSGSRGQTHPAPLDGRGEWDGNVFRPERFDGARGDRRTADREAPDRDA